MKIRDLKFLTDENISPRVVSFFRQKGFDVIDVKEERWHGTEDKRLMEMAYKAKQFIITHDVDFGTLAINEGVSFYGIIYLRLKNVKVSNVITVLEKLLMLDTGLQEGALIVVEDTRVRMRTT